MLARDQVQKTLGIANALGLLDQGAADDVLASFDAGSPFRAVLEVANCMHVHIKVDETASLPRAALLAGGAVIDNEKDGYIKFACPSGMNLIFSSINVAQDDLRESPDQRRPRPFLDHVGIDLRDPAPAVRAAFDGIVAIADQNGYPRSSQGGAGKAVFCCHVSVAEKHWVYPTRAARRLAPVEIAFGPLVINADSSGCDLRPADPSLAAASPACGTRCGAP
ncbi:hypothetical protein [Massilia sp. CCM 8734]|uniref:hypothetical protein n=1 Tax=Massilia sp. CCM 8734 TaxID=2609283 RepID=UPI001424159F|nr:hypothetical protein [Massilia sp. CCM 8734]NHZ98515.1 hypothetical protein [Massilia sp. CCM 8734]